MGKWTELLLQQINFEIRPPKSTDETDETPLDHDDDTGKMTKPDSFVSFDSDFPGACSEKTPVDPEAIIERSAIQEYDGNLERDRANMKASAAYDRNRQRYEDYWPDRDPSGVEGLYAAYIQDWRPDGPDDLPATPPNTRGNAKLWRQWWAKIEHATAVDDHKEDS